MLVLTRKLQQQIKIGEQITITVVRVKGNTVRLGVAAPRDMRVVRAELPQDGSVNLLLPPEDAPERGSEEQPAAEVDASAATNGTHHPAPNLPQRRPFDRYGSAPLKRLVAQTVLAK
jgi:carbon storage regulator CsrA